MTLCLLLRRGFEDNSAIARTPISKTLHSIFPKSAWWLFVQRPKMITHALPPTVANLTLGCMCMALSRAPKCGSSPNCPCGMSAHSLPTLSLPLPPTLWLLVQCPGRGPPRLVWGRGPKVQGVWGGRALQAALGARPTSGGTRH